MGKLILGILSRAANIHVWSTLVIICAVILFLAATAHAETSWVKVVTIHQGAAIGDTEVLLYSPTGKKLDYQGISNAEGAITFHIPAGSYKFCVKHNGARIWSDVVHALPGEETNVTLDLEQLARDNTRDPNPVRFDGTPPEEEPVMLASLTGITGILTQPAVAVTSRDKLYWFVNDHLGTPMMVVDENQAVVWQGYQVPFGDTTITVNTIENNFRFPGQYFDDESGLHYNYHRYYDPSVGRYITSDPIGLVGGINPFLYSLGNPVNFIDPDGLKMIFGSQAGFMGFDYSWDTSDSGKAKVTAGSGVIAGGAFSIGWQADNKSGIFGESIHEIVGKSAFNFGFGRYLSFSFAPDLSKINFNIGLGLALPVSHTVPVEGIDVTFGDDLYDWLHNLPQATKCK